MYDMNANQGRILVDRQVPVRRLDRAIERNISMPLGQFNNPADVIITNDSKHVIVADMYSNRLQVFKLICHFEESGDESVNTNQPLNKISCKNIELEFVRSIGPTCSKSNREMKHPMGLAFLSPNGGEQTVLVAESGGKMVSHWTVEGTHIRDFGNNSMGIRPGEADAKPEYVIVLPHSNNIAVTDRNNERVALFKTNGDFIRHIRNNSLENVQTISHRPRPGGPLAIAADDFDNIIILFRSHSLQVFNSEGQHLITRDNFCKLKRYDYTSSIEWNGMNNGRLTIVKNGGIISYS